MVSGPCSRRQLILSTALLASVVTQQVATAEGNYTNIIVREEDGALQASSVQSALSHELPSGTLDLAFGTGPDGFDGHVVVAGPSALFAGGGNADKARELRHAAMLFAQWLNSERGGLVVAGQRLAMTLFWVDDGNSKVQVANATSRALRLMPADFALGGYSSSLTVYSAAQARADGKLMITAGSSRASLFREDDPLVFSFLPSADDKLADLYESIVHIAEELDAGRVNASHPEACGSAGCRAQLRYGSLGVCQASEMEIAEAVFGQVTDHEPASDETTVEELRLALGRLKTSKVTVLKVCKLSVGQLRNVTEIMEELSFEVDAIISTSSVMLSEFKEEMTKGWWHSAYILDATPWLPTRGAPGSFSGITSEEFAERYYAAFGEWPTYLGAAQFAALCALSVAVESAGTLDSKAVAGKLHNLSLSEFYGNIRFSKASSQVLLDHHILQAPQADLHEWEPQIVSRPARSGSQRFVFPKPPWAQERCRYESTTADGQECSGHGECGLDGQCVCDDPWAGSFCQEREVADSNAEDKLNQLVDSAIAVSATLACIMVIAVLACCLHRRRRLLEASYVQQLESAVARGAEEQILDAKRHLCSLGWTRSRVDNLLESSRKRHSEEAGISVAYLLSQEFLDLSRARTGKDDPTFYDLKDGFFFGGQPIGADIVCPRDGKLGCALIDTLPPQYRQQTTHFLSWTWGYKVSTIRSALIHWLKTSNERAEDVFMYMCFFVNNQYRILVSTEKTGSEDLEHCFESNLSRIRKVVAVLDTWDNPRYLTRIWTIFEQLIAIKLDIPVTMVLPEESAQDLLLEIEQGKAGILRVKEALTKVDSQSAKASCVEDEDTVKALIKKSFRDGFGYVDRQIVQFMVQWVGHEMEAHMKELVNKGE